MSFAGLEDYQGPQEVNRSAVLQVEGTSRCKLKAGEFDIVGEEGKKKGQVFWTVELTDPDLVGNAIRGRTFVNGIDKNNQSMARQVADILVGCGMMTAEQVRQAAAAKTGVLASDLIAQCIGKDTFCRFQHGSYTKNGMRYPTTEVDGFIDLALYEKSKVDKKHRVEKKRNTEPTPDVGGAGVVNPVAATPFGGAGAASPFGGGGAPAPVQPAFGGGAPAAPTFAFAQNGAAPAGAPPSFPNLNPAGAMKLGG